MRKMISALLIAMLALCAVGFAEEIEIVPIVTVEAVNVVKETATPTPAQTQWVATVQPAATAAPVAEVAPVASVEPTAVPEPEQSPSMGTLMRAGRPTTSISVGGIFGGGSSVPGSEVPRASITSIRFEASLADAPSEAWDVSQEQNGSVLAWVTDNALTIAGEGGVYAGQDLAYLFAGYSAVESIDFNNCFHTQETIDMSHMFESCWSLTSLDVSSFDTSNVVDMSYMFGNCTELRTLNVQGFDTSDVMYMTGMFFMNEALEEIDLSSFDTSNVMEMSSMFESCSALTALDISSFDTHAVEFMHRMFSNCTAMEEIKIGMDFFPAANAEDMFENCPAAIGGDFEDFVAADMEADFEFDSGEAAEETVPNAETFALWTRSEKVRQLQTRLSEVGYYTSNVDGVYGPNTQAALRAWQQANGYEANAALDAEQEQLLLG